jgi:DNA-binding HxlR family transcriptional regulator
MASGQASVCTRFHQAVELIGARWTGAILHVLMRGPVRYADLRAAVPEISDRMLCERLRALEEATIVVRHVSPDPPVRVDYELTDKGRALEPALTAIGRWAERWVDPQAVPSPAPATPSRPRAARHPRRATTPRRGSTGKARASS